jgi:hypothetical protein
LLALAGLAAWALWGPDAEQAPAERVASAAPLPASGAVLVPGPASAAPSGPQAAPLAPAGGDGVSVQGRSSGRSDASDAGGDLADHVPAGSAPSMSEVIEALHARGIRTGLGAFNPPGTRPALIGLAVPEDFELPPGYVRHHQATDDGQRIEAILMFAPDFRLFDAQGRELALPADRVVPPELAPPGLPLRRIVLPPPVAASGP